MSSPPQICNTAPDRQDRINSIDSTWLPTISLDSNGGIDLFIVGIGTFPAKIEGDKLVRYQITPQAERALTICKKVLHLSTYGTELAKILPDPSRLDDLNVTYNQWTDHTTKLQKVADEIWRKATDARNNNQGPVAFVTYGSVIYGDSVSLMVLDKNFQEPTASRLSYQVIPGVSSFETVIADLLINPAPGLQIHEANTLLSEDYAIEMKLPVLILQVDLLRRMVESDPATLSTLSLSNFLMGKGYATTQPIYFRRSYDGQQAAVTQETTVGQIDQELLTIEDGVTAYIPGT